MVIGRVREQRIGVRPERRLEGDERADQALRCQQASERFELFRQTDLVWLDEWARTKLLSRRSRRSVDHPRPSR